MTTHMGFTGDNPPVDAEHAAADKEMEWQQTLFDPEIATTTQPTDSSTGSEADYDVTWPDSAQPVGGTDNSIWGEPAAWPTAAGVQPPEARPYLASAEQPEGWWKRVSSGRNKGFLVAGIGAFIGLAAVIAGGAGDSGKDRDPSAVTAPGGDTPQADGYEWLDGQVGGGQQDNGLPTGTEGAPADGEITGDGAPPEEISGGEEVVGGIDFRSPENRSLEFTPEYATSDDMEEVMKVLYRNIGKAISQRNPEYLEHVYCSSVSESSQFWRNIVALADNHYDVMTDFSVDSAHDFGNGMWLVYGIGSVSIDGDPPGLSKASFRLRKQPYSRINPQTQQLESGHELCIEDEDYQDP